MIHQNGMVIAWLNSICDHSIICILTRSEFQISAPLEICGTWADLGFVPWYSFDRLRLGASGFAWPTFIAALPLPLPLGKKIDDHPALFRTIH